MSASDWAALERTLEQMSSAEKLQLIERIASSLRSKVQPVSCQDQHEAIKALQAKLAGLPVGNPADGLSARDHDQILYGKP